MEGRYRFDAPAAGTFLLPAGAVADGGTGIAIGNAGAGLSVFYLDPALYTANTRSNFHRIAASALVNATAPTGNFTVGLYPVTAVAGGAATLSVTLGAVVAGSTVAFTTPGASSLGQGNSGDYAAPAAGYYALACVVSGAAAANSSVSITARVNYRQV